jgi:LysM repeat protein
MPYNPPFEHHKEGRMVYVVKPGDTLYNIAARFNTTVDAILRANPDIQNPSLIYPGQRIIIPTLKESEISNDTKTQSDNDETKESEKKDDKKEDDSQE